MRVRMSRKSHEVGIFGHVLQVADDKQSEGQTNTGPSWTEQFLNGPP
jgi:hypothetical protein